MSQQYPNPFVSIPRSFVSLKLYYEVHDQPVTRTLLFLVISAVGLAVMVLGIDVVGRYRDAGAYVATLRGRLDTVTFRDGKAQAGGEQPRVLWEYRAGGEEDSRIALLVLDTTGQLSSIDEAAEFVGHPRSKRILFFSRETIESYERNPERGSKEKPPTYSYDDAEGLAELRKLIEENGGTLPELKVVDGAAKFDLPEGKVHILCQTSALTALVNATGKAGPLRDVLPAAMEEDKELRERLVPPQFLALLSATTLVLKVTNTTQEAELAFEDQGELSAEAVAQWVASTMRQMRVSALTRFFLPLVLMYGLQMVIVGLMCSVAGLVANRVLRGGLAYGELLTMAMHATVPAMVIALLFAQVARLPANTLWAMTVPVSAGMVYTALGTVRTVRLRAEEFTATI